MSGRWGKQRGLGLGETAACRRSLSRRERLSRKAAALPRARRCRHAFTLVEMLVAMVLTLIMVSALAEFYAYVGETVRDGRAMIELNGQMRTVVQRLKSDLDLITVRVAPWNDDGAAAGYFEISEGMPYTRTIAGTPYTIRAASDLDVNGNWVLDTTSDGADEDGDWASTIGDGTADWQQAGVTNLLGDGDDVIAMTIRASGEPFTGRQSTKPMEPPIITSQHAEVVWWVGFDDRPHLTHAANNKWDLDEPRKLYRRQLLIRPDFGRIGRVYDDSERGIAINDLLMFLQANDISASLRWSYDRTAGGKYWIQANTLADLARREHRFAHLPVQVVNIESDPAKPLDLRDGNFPYPLQLVPAPSASSPSPSVFVLQGAHEGEDVVISNLLAFDVRVYDPYAPLLADVPQSRMAESLGALTPSDPGFVTAAYSYTASDRHPQVGAGAFVDLGYGLRLAQMLQNSPYGMTPANAATLVGSIAGNSHFAVANNYYAATGTSRAIGLAYDTWSLSYEHDGVNQNMNRTGGMNPVAIVDEGTNGLDDDGSNGVDDANERETQPPYLRPLRGIEVKIRVYEPATRQMRQATVAADFIDE